LKDVDFDFVIKKVTIELLRIILLVDFEHVRLR